MLPLVLRKSYIALQDKLESELVCMRKENEYLEERHGRDQDYQRNLEKTVDALRADNSKLFAANQILKGQIRSEQNKNNQLMLMIGSLEARWGKGTSI